MGSASTRAGGAISGEARLRRGETNIRSAHFPPRDQIVVAGTVDDGQTLYFDLKWFDQITRTGLTEYAFWPRSPGTGAATSLRSACTARKGGTVAGRLAKVVGLYLAATTRPAAGRETVGNGRPASPMEKDLVTNSIGTRLKLIPAGSFLRGATPNEGG